MQTMTQSTATRKHFLSEEARRKLTIALLIPTGILCGALLFILGKGM